MKLFFCGLWTASNFLNFDRVILVVKPADTKTHDKEKYQKTEALDLKIC